MKTELLVLLRCPQTGQMLRLENCDENTLEIKAGWLISDDGQHRYSIVEGIPRFVPQSNYADNFCTQCNHLRQTQLDSFSGHPIPTERFWQVTGWQLEKLRDKWVLEAGCGAGRFAEVALLAGAKVIELDCSSIVEACYANLKHHPNLHVVQGDIYSLPFAPEAFQFVHPLGALQYTPHVVMAFAALPLMMQKGGRLCADFFWKHMRTMLHAKYLFRPLTKRMNQGKLLQLLQRWVPTLLGISQVLVRVPLIGLGLKRILPVEDCTGRLTLRDQQLKECAFLDTFYMIAVTYDNPQSADTVHRWFEQTGMAETGVGHWSHLVGRGIKPA